MYLAKGFGDLALLQPVIDRRPSDVALDFEELGRAMHFGQCLVRGGYPKVE